jgi:hypothetical protein
MPTPPDGAAVAYGFISGWLRDLARFGVFYTPSWNTVVSEHVVTLEILERIRKGVRSTELFREGFDGPVSVGRLNDHNDRQRSPVGCRLAGRRFREGGRCDPDALCLSSPGSGDRILFDMRPGPPPLRAPDRNLGAVPGVISVMEKIGHRFKEHARPTNIIQQQL